MPYDPLKSTWLNPNIEYVFDNDIIEYDMHDAGFTLIKQFKLLPPDLIEHLEYLGKGMDRHITIGKLQGQDQEFSKALLDAFAKMRAIFVEANKLTDDRIISVKKDAIFTIGRCNKTKFDQVEFAEKNHYSSYLRLANINNLEIYYSDTQTDIKGMSQSAINRHRLYMLDFLEKTISMIESKDQRTAKQFMKFLMSYKAGELDEEYYVEFNSLSRDRNPIFNYQNILIPLVQIIMREVNR